MTHMSVTKMNQCTLEPRDIYTVDAYYSEPEISARNMTIRIRDLTLMPSHPGAQGKLVNIAEANIVFNGVLSSTRCMREYLNDPRNEPRKEDGGVAPTAFGAELTEHDFSTDVGHAAQVASSQTYEFQGGVLRKNGREFAVNSWVIQAERAFLEIVSLKK